MKKIFLSHSSKDFELTAKLCDQLESAGASCWLSERDLDRSANYWQEELIHAISDSSAVVLILTGSALASGEVLNEIASASARNKLIIPYLAENVPLSPQMEYYIRKFEWISAWDMPFQQSFRLLTDRLSLRIEDPSSPTQPEIRTNPLLAMENICFEGIQCGSYGAGFDKCLVKTSNAGWSPYEIVLEDVDCGEFTFASIGYPEYDEQYRAFLETPEVRKMRSRGNDRVRWMLTDIYQNDKIYLTLRRTHWSVLTFWWNQVRDNGDMQRRLARHAFGAQTPFFPNSLCLHLILETADDQLLCTQISRNKSNDYPFTIAVTLGEQLSEIDFHSGKFNNNRFIFDWCKRACMEEFGFSNDDYARFVEESSLRVLGIDYEGDIYNFAIPLLVRLKITLHDLLAYLRNHPGSWNEFTSILPMSPEEAAEVLRRCSKPEIQRQYHPSSFLRMLLYIAYKKPELLK